MERALWVAKTGLDAQQTRIAVISNNLANVNTTAFKRGNAIFEDLLYQNLGQAGAQSTQDTQFPTGLNLGTGVKTVGTAKLFTQGNLVKTDSALDVAIDGKGFIEIAQPDGSIAYTRDGSFKINADGLLVNSSGYQLQSSVTIPAGASGITIGEDGTVSVTVAGSATPTNVGNIQLADFINPQGLQPIGKNLFVESAASGSPQVGTPGQDGLGSLTQGFLESSNVNVVEELVNMIEAQRAYEMNSKAIQATDGMLRYVANNL
ncbi:MAG: flagellar basal-body rod protein FlgG [Gammaproteobacteria bacterium]|nr:flagellar basal-body rod protein FlgG [Gammaproteobacteria bacterium]